MTRNRNVQNIWFSLALGTVFILLLWGIYGKIIFYPNQFMLSDEGEALRSYYVMAYQLKHDSSWIEHHGMNYPFAEHLTYADGQPGMLWIAKVVCFLFPELKNWGVGFVNLITIGSLVLGCILLFLVQLDWKIPVLWAAVIAIAIMLLSPQVARIKWQPALGNNLYIPLFFFLYTKFCQSNSLRWRVLLFVSTCFAFLVHPYLGLMQCIMILITTFFHQVRITRKIQNILIHAILPIVVFMLFMQLTDTHVNRVSNPDGVVKFSANLGTVFLSMVSPLKRLYKPILDISPDQLINYFEGWAYIGFSGILFLLFLLIRLLIAWTDSKRVFHNIPESLRALFIASTIMLIFSFSLPFKVFDTSKEILDVIPPLRQFRALGRFAWFFVFALHLLLGYWLVEQWKRTKSSTFIFLFVGLFSLSVWEGVNLHRFAAKDITQNVISQMNYGLENMEQRGIKLSELNVQAIVPIPYFHVGSHRFRTKSNTPIKFLNEFLPFAYQTNLPVTSSFFARNSIDESIHSFTFFANDVFEKTIINYIKEEPLLIYHDKRFRISEEELNILRKSNTLFEDNQLKMALLNPIQLSENSSVPIFNQLRSHPNDFVQAQGLIVDSQYADQVVRYGSDTIQTQFGIHNSFFDSDVHSPHLPSGRYKMSFWFNHTSGRTNVRLLMNQYDKKSGSLIESQVLINALNSFNIMKDHVLCEISYDHDVDRNTLLYFEEEFDMHIDHLMISYITIGPDSSNVFDQRVDSWYWNNKPLKLE